jgi:hypothetical protein
MLDAHNHPLSQVEIGRLSFGLIALMIWNGKQYEQTRIREHDVFGSNYPFRVQGGPPDTASLNR